MAKIDVNLYFLEMQDQYYEMLDNLKEFKELSTEGAISQDEYDNMLREVELLRNNYERLAYIMFLLNKPSSKNAKKRNLNLSWYSELKGASKEAVLDENANVLADLKNLIKLGKERFNG